jgi:hypothetical protein
MVSTMEYTYWPVRGSVPSELHAPDPGPPGFLERLATFLADQSIDLPE